MQDAAEARERGMQFFREGKYAEAALYLRQARAAAPQDLAVHFHLGAALFQLGRPQDALAAFQEALTIDPQSPQAHFNVAQAHLHLSQPAEALAELQTVQRLQPDYPGLSEWLARAQEAAAQALPARQLQPAAGQPLPPPQGAPTSFEFEEMQPPSEPAPFPFRTAAGAASEAWYTPEELEEAELRATTVLNRGKAICFISWAIGSFFLFSIFASVVGIFAVAMLILIMVPLVYFIILDAHEWVATNPKIMTPIAIVGACFSVAMFIWALGVGLFD